MNKDQIPALFPFTFILYSSLDLYCDVSSKDCLTILIIVESLYGNIISMAGHVPCMVRYPVIPNHSKQVHGSDWAVGRRADILLHFVDDDDGAVDGPLRVVAPLQLLKVLAVQLVTSQVLWAPALTCRDQR